MDTVDFDSEIIVTAPSKGSDRPSRSVVLVTDRMRLTTWLDDDLDDLRVLHRDPEVMRYLKSGVETEEQTRARLARFRREQRGFGWTKWRLENREGAMAGRAGFNLSDDRRRRELGYVLTPRLWGQGLATEVAVALVRWHKANLDPALEPELIAYAYVHNSPSRRVLEKAGFIFIEEVHRDGTVDARYQLT